MGAAILFVVSFVGAVIIAIYVLAYSASALLVVVEGTAAGNDEVPWPNEPYADIIRRAAYLAFLIGLWLIPAGFLWNALRDVLLPNDRVLRLLLVCGPGLWLFFPLGLFSSLRSESGYGVLRWDMLRDMVRVGPATFLVYALSLFLIAMVATLWYFTLMLHGMLLLIAAPVTGYAWIVYARLLGRLALKIGMLRPTSGDRRSRRKERQAEKTAARHREEMGPNLPTQEAPAEPRKQARPAWLDPEPAPYALSDEEPPARTADVPLDGYDPLEAENTAPAEPGMDRVEAANRAVTDRDKRVTRRRKPAKLPEHPLLEGIWNFPFYPQCVGPLVNLAFGWGMFGAMVLIMGQSNPYA